MSAFGQLPGIYETKRLGSITYRVLNPALVSGMKGALVGWKIRNIETRGTTEVATATPFVEDPIKPGDAFKWTDVRASQGRGIIIEMPIGWDWSMPNLSQALMHTKVGELKIISTDDFRELAAAAEHIDGVAWSVPPTGVVLYEPKGGWRNVTNEPPDLSEPGEQKASFSPWLLGAAAVLVTTGILIVATRR